MAAGFARVVFAGFGGLAEMCSVFGRRLFPRRPAGGRFLDRQRPFAARARVLALARLNNEGEGAEAEEEYCEEWEEADAVALAGGLSGDRASEGRVVALGVLRAGCGTVEVPRERAWETHKCR